MTLWGQSNGGYGGGFNPANPANPSGGDTTRKYELKVTAGEGGSVSHSPSGTSFTAGTNIYLSASPNTGYKFRYWQQGDSIISGSQWYYYTMPAKKSEVKAVFEYSPVSPDNPAMAPRSYKVTVSSSGGGSVYCSNEKVNVGTYTYVSASPYTGYRFTGWMLDGKIVSRDSYYYFEMEARDMHFTAQFVFDPTFDPSAPGNPNSNPNSKPLYTLEYRIDGHVCHTEQLPAGAAVTAIATPVKEGYSFNGWSGLPTTMPAKNVTVNGTFSLNYYNVTYTIDGETFATDSVAFGSTIELIGTPEKEGHTFSGWKNVPSKMPAKDIVISGTFNVNYYTITYVVDGQNFDTASFAYGSEISLIDIPVKEGHTFSGWSEAPKTMPAKDITISGTFAVNSYKITYVIGEEKVHEEDIVYGDTIVPPTKFEKEGYRLNWNNLPVTMPAKDIVVEGSYSLNKYLVTYLVDGEIHATDSVEYSASLTLPEEPTKEGHSFSGWEGLPETMPASDITVNAKFSVNSYKVTFLVDGEVHATDSVKYGASLTLPKEPVKEGHTFSGWSEAPATMPANDIVVEGSFTVNYYAVTYLVDGEVWATDSLAYGSELVLRDEPAKEGHTFSGWSEAPTTMPASDVVVEGSFTVNYYTVTYILDGEVWATDSLAYGSELVLRDEPTKDGHTFSGWSEAPATMPASDVVIEGSFTVNSYSVIYKVDGEEYKVVPTPYGSKIVLIDEPVKEGHTFSGWSEAPATMPANDVIIEGSFTVNYYTVTYIVDGEVYATDSVAYGSKISLPEHPVREGYSFSGWKNVPSSMPANDIEITGSFVTNGYTVTYMVDGKEYASYVVEFGAPLTLPEEPTKEGHSFSGWEGLPDTMPASDITVNAKFSVNSYKVTYVVDSNEYASYTVEYGAEIPTPETPVKDGHTFSGWSEAPATMPASDVIIEGSFTVNYYTVTYIVDGDVWATDSLAYGSEVVLRDEPTKEGHTFSGWSEAPTTMPANDITVEGAFAVNSYTVTYLVDGEEYASYTVEYGAEVPVPEDPVKEGYLFEGWTSIPEAMPAEDIVIEAIFVVDTGIILLSDGKPRDVYSLTGLLLVKQATYEEIMLLPQGTYIIEGKKVYIRH